MKAMNLPTQNLTLSANPEIEFLDALRLFDSLEITMTISSPKAEREYLKVLGILEPISQFHQTNIISSGKEDNEEIDYKEVLFKNKAVVVTAKENILRIVDELIWNIENRIETYIVEDSGWVYEVSEKLNFKEIQFLVKADNDTIKKFEKQNLSILVSIYRWSEKKLIPIRIASKFKVHNRCNHKEGNCQLYKLIRLLLITEEDPETGEPSQYYCLIQEKEELEKLAGYTTKHNSRLYVCDYCVSHQTHDPKIDAQHIKNCKGINTLVQRTVMSLELNKINLNFSKEYEKLSLLKHYLKGLYQALKRDSLGVDIEIMYYLANTIYCKFDAHLIFQAMGRISREKISIIPHNMKSYLTLDIENQRYIDSLQLMSRFFDSYISNLEAELCKEERFLITRENGPKGKNDLVFHKAPFLYNWFNTSEKIDATSLSPIEAFDNCLERFRKLIKGKFGLDIAHYVSLSLFAEDALYKTTEQEIELFTDDNMYLFCKKDETPDLFNKITKWKIPDNAEKGYILEVDFDYLYKLHKAHTSYPLASENIKISKEKISKCGQEIINDLKHYTKTKKLIPNLNNKKNLWMKPFMKELARSYALVKNDFEKNMYKLLGNANYRKTIENIHKYQRIDFVRPEEESKKFKKLVADLSYKSHRILAENLVDISYHQSKAKLSKPIFIDMSVLDKMVYTNTDSLILLIRTENVYKNMAEMHEHFDFSNYKLEHLIYKALKKEKIILNKKSSCYIFADGKTDRRAKEIQKVVVKKNLTHNISTIWACFKEVFDQERNARNLTFDEMCNRIEVCIQDLGGKIKTTTIKNFYNNSTSCKSFTLNDI
ncbi:17213_t:CDS:10, partial [Cetraspora pellucida]